MEVILTGFYILLFVILIYKWRFFELPFVNKHLITLSFAVKIIAAFALFLIYTFFYTDRTTADIFKYYDDARVLFDIFRLDRGLFFDFVHGTINDDSNSLLLSKISNWSRFHEDMLFNDNKTIILFCFVLLFPAIGFYWPLVVFFVFLSFIGLIAFYKFLVGELRKYHVILYCMLFFFPSILIWTSGVLKESLLILFLGLFLYSFRKIGKFQIGTIILLLLSFGGLLFIKHYVIAALLPGLLVYKWHDVDKRSSPIIKFLLVMLGLLLIILLNHFYFKWYPLLEAIAVKHNDFINWVETLGNVGSYVEMERYKPEFISILSNVPLALFNTSLRPLPWEVSNVLMLLPALENIFIVLFTIYIIRNRDLTRPNGVFSIFAISFLILLFTLSGLICPVIGALVRYKMPALPILCALLLYHTDLARAKAFFRTDILLNKRIFLVFFKDGKKI
ncbi:MAG: hypothetical protein IPO21_16180 [Bacteroidales bacterium]|nr:hypothetical protein [Bacteroidales bacterium]